MNWFKKDNSDDNCEIEQRVKALEDAERKTRIISDKMLIDNQEVGLFGWGGPWPHKATILTGNYGSKILELTLIGETPYVLEEREIVPLRDFLLKNYPIKEEIEEAK